MRGETFNLNQYKRHYKTGARVSQFLPTPIAMNLNPTPTPQPCLQSWEASGNYLSSMQSNPDSGHPPHAYVTTLNLYFENIISRLSTI